MDGMLRGVIIGISESGERIPCQWDFSDTEDEAVMNRGFVGDEEEAEDEGEDMFINDNKHRSLDGKIGILEQKEGSNGSSIDVEEGEEAKQDIENARPPSTISQENQEDERTNQENQEDDTNEESEQTSNDISRSRDDTTEQLILRRRRRPRRRTETTSCSPSSSLSSSSPPAQSSPQSPPQSPALPPPEVD